MTKSRWIILLSISNALTLAGFISNLRANRLWVAYARNHVLPEFEKVPGTPPAPRDNLPVCRVRKE